MPVLAIIQEDFVRLMLNANVTKEIESLQNVGVLMGLLLEAFNFQPNLRCKLIPAHHIKCCASVGV